MKQALLIALTGLWGVAEAAPVDRVAAVVNDKVITLSQVYEMGRPHIERLAASGEPGARREAELEVLDQQIRYLLIEQEMARLKLDVDDRDVDGHLEYMVSQNGFADRDALRQAVESSGAQWDAYVRDLRRNIRHQKFQAYIIRPRIVENEDALLDAYNRMVSDPNRPQEVDLGALFVPLRADSEEERARVLALVTEAKRRFEAGEPFSALSAELDVAGFGQAGGSMGTFGPGEIMAELDGPAFSVPVGQVTEPIMTSRGVYLLEIRRRELQPVASFEDIKASLSQTVFEEQYLREEDDWYQAQRRRSSVEVKLEEPGKQ